MVSRRRCLRAGGAAALAALAGCAGGNGGDGERDATDNASSGDGLRLTGEAVAPADVPDGATVAVSERDLHGLVADAATADGRVDLDRGGSGPGQDATLTLGAFPYVEFAGDTYEPTASFAPAGTETVYQYELAAVDDADAPERGNDVLRYGDLADGERAFADRLLDDGTHTVGRHEQRPPGAEPFRPGRYLRTGDAAYRVRVSVGDVPAHHMLALDPADPGSDARVVTVADRAPDPEWAGVFAAVLGAGTVSIEGVADAEGLVDYLDGVGYVATAADVLSVEVAGAGD
ncbi:hypothetical protein [Halobacterium jilantaiense]|uniref:Uncharacterized protein n=1 Tax=Halobacterium jilantaiense TaxID=355548 RepID=A0A1I0PJ56_9EURY|nr:hypothetical protein [Halobacterium jilantaiense]SEW14388.1 hypothetical protein SAMN04487945_1731 [Halobacterium jilantaiense]